jgi:lactate dehydrogenase-like 2-hydroxyacid dehydrogenase
LRPLPSIRRAPELTDSSYRTNTVLLPHVGFENVEAMSAKADIALCHLENFLHGRGLAS